MLSLALLAQLIAGSPAPAPATIPTCGPSVPYGAVCVWRAPVYVVHGTAQRQEGPAAIPGPEMRVSVLWELPVTVDPVQAFHLNLDVAVGDGGMCSFSNRFILGIDKGQVCR